MQLVIGNKSYSSWSMRAWVLLTHFKVEFEEVRIPLFTADYQRALARYSPSLKVPALVDGGLTLWDSLAISEYISEKYLQGTALPESLSTSAMCWAYCCEMHSGFLEIRNQLPMNCRRRLNIGAALQGEIHRVDALWAEAFKGRAGDEDYLFGEFSITDSFFVSNAC